MAAQTKPATIEKLDTWLHVHAAPWWMCLVPCTLYDKQMLGENWLWALHDIRMVIKHRRAQ